MIRRYFDNAATSFPKPPEVLEAVSRFMTDIGASGRGLYHEANLAASILNSCRRRLARLINLPGGESHARNIIFSHNTSDALNLAIHGSLQHALRISRHLPLHVVTTTAEHNSILRPLHTLTQHLGPAHLRWTKVPTDPRTGLVDPDDLLAAVIPGQTRLVAVNHASNVTGAVQDIQTIGSTLRNRIGLDPRQPGGVLFLLDAAQSLGHLPIDMAAAAIDLLAFPGHKGLLGPQGTGGLAIRPGVELILDPIRQGGTGNSSEDPFHPDILPEKYEPGSHNAAGIAGLDAALAWIESRSIHALHQHERELAAPLLAALRNPDHHDLPGLHLLGHAALNHRVGVFSFTHDSYSPAELSNILESSFGILSRPGLHCAPLVHQHAGTLPTGGACRISLGPFLTHDDVQFTLDALRKLCQTSVSV